MSDTIIIQAVYIAIGPFFVVEGAGGDGEAKGKGKPERESVVLRTLGKSAMRGLRLDALALIRSVSRRFSFCVCGVADRGARFLRTMRTSGRGSSRRS